MTEFDDDDFMHGFSGGISLIPIPPTPEQQEAEKVTRELLFGEEQQSPEVKQKIAELQVKIQQQRETLPKKGTIEGWRYEMDDPIITQYRSEITEIERNQQIQMMLNSPMFQNNDGFTAINDFELPSNLETMFQSNETIDASQLDDFYKELDVT